MLEFPSIDYFENTVVTLKDKMSSHWDAFVKEYSYLDEEALNEMEKKIGFVDQQPLLDFENEFNFTNSMRQVFVVEEQKWLNNDELDSLTNPSKIYVFDIEEMTLLNKDGEVKIGESILKMTKDGFLWIKDGDLSILDRFNKGDLSVFKEPNVVTNLDEVTGKGDCSSWKGRDYTHAYASNRKVILHVHFHSWPWKGAGQSEITSYKKSGSSWNKYSMSLSVRCDSKFRDKDCMFWTAGGTTGWKTKTAKSIEQTFNSWGSFPAYRAENGNSIIGGFEYNGYSNGLSLIW